MGLSGHFTLTGPVKLIPVSLSTRPTDQRVVMSKAHVTTSGLLKPNMLKVFKGGDGKLYGKAFVSSAAIKPKIAEEKV